MKQTKTLWTAKAVFAVISSMRKVGCSDKWIVDTVLELEQNED